MKIKKVIYFVEGETEMALINAIKNNYIISGKVQKINLWESDVTLYLRQYTAKSHIICILDTDVMTSENESKKNNNLKKLRKYYIVDVVSQRKNLEDEIVSSTSIKNISEMYEIRNIDKHKKQFINDKNLLKTLENLEFNINKFWLDGGKNIKNSKKGNNN